MLDRPALNLAIVADEPEAAAVVPVLDRAGLDRRAINRKAVKHRSTIRDMIVDRNGRSLITLRRRTRTWAAPMACLIRGLRSKNSVAQVCSRPKAPAVQALGSTTARASKVQAVFRL
jgi:hypothetical protein